MKIAQTKWDVTFENLPLFSRVSHRQIWEGLPRQTQEKVVHLVSDLLLAYVESSQKGGESHKCAHYVDASRTQGVGVRPPIVDASGLQLQGEPAPTMCHEGAHAGSGLEGGRGY